MPRAPNDVAEAQRSWAQDAGQWRLRLNDE